MCICACEGWCLRRLDVSDIPGAGGTSGCEQPNMGAGNGTVFLKDVLSATTLTYLLHLLPLYQQ